MLNRIGAVSERLFTKVFHQAETYLRKMGWQLSSISPGKDDSISTSTALVTLAFAQILSGAEIDKLCSSLVCLQKNHNVLAAFPLKYGEGCRARVPD
jgi:hypothetical protein